MSMRTNMNPFFSIIIPIYNSEKYLDRCLASICNQTFSSFEVLLINDGSSDNSLEICNKWAQKDSRIIVLSQKNYGASAARNKGIKEATGKYIQLVDSDDTISPECLEKIYGIILQDKYPDLVEFRLSYHSYDGRTSTFGTILQPGKYDRQFLQEEFLPVHLLIKEDSKIYYNIYNVLRFIKTDLLRKNNILFNEKIRRWEDWLFAMLVFNSAENMSVTHQVLYHYMGHEEGGLGGKYNPNTYEYVIEAFKMVENIFRDEFCFDTPFALFKRCEFFDRCAKEIFDNETGNERKMRLQNLLKNDYVSDVIRRNTSSAGLGKIQKEVVRKSWNKAYYKLSFYYAARNIRNHFR